MSSGQPSSRPLLPGVYVATMTFFHSETGNLDIASLRIHIARLACAGITGVVVMGSNGEAPHLSNAERQTVTRETRAVLDSKGFSSVPIIVGCSDQYAMGTLDLIRDAQQAGGDYALVLPPSYFREAMNNQIINDFYREVATASPLPILLYSFPAVTAGITMSSDLLISVSRHPNVVGTKFTCGDTGKIGRVAAATDAVSPLAPSPPLSNYTGPYYVTLGGLADFILPALVAGASGVIAGGSNVFPKICRHVFQSFCDGSLEDAIRAQKLLNKADWAHTKRGVAGTKAVLQKHFGYGGIPRRPLPPLSSDDEIALMSEVEEAIAWEKELELQNV